MIIIEKINRAYKFHKSGTILNPVVTIYYIETEEEFLKNNEKLCNHIGKANIISIQFLNGEKNEIDKCIITYKEKEAHK